MTVETFSNDYFECRDKNGAYLGAFWRAGSGASKYGYRIGNGVYGETGYTSSKADAKRIVKAGGRGGVSLVATKSGLRLI